MNNSFVSLRFTAVIALAILAIPPVSLADEFSEGIKAAFKEDFDRAIAHFDRYEKGNASLDPTETMRLRLWFGVINLAAGNSKQQGVAQMEQALCAGLPAQFSEAFSSTCDDTHRVDELDTADQDMLAVALVSLASERWNASDYSTALKLYRNANLLLLQKPTARKTKSSAITQNIPRSSSLASFLVELSAQERDAHEKLMSEIYQLTLMSGGDSSVMNDPENSPATLPYKLISLKKTYVKAVLSARCKNLGEPHPGAYTTGFEKLLNEYSLKTGEDLTSFIDQVNSLGEKPLLPDDCKVGIEASTRKSSRHQKIEENLYSKKTVEKFYRVAHKVACPSTERDVDSNNLMATVFDTMAEAAGSAIEVKRGNRFSFYNTARLPVLQEYSDYMASYLRVADEHSETSRQGKFRLKIAACGDRSELTEKITKGVYSALNRGSEDIEYFEEALKALELILRKGRRSGPYYGSPIITAYREIAQKHIQAGQIDRALLALRKAVNVMESSSPGETEFDMMAWLRVLVSLSNLLNASASETREVSTALELVKDKQRPLAQKALRISKMDYKERAIHEDQEIISGLNIDQQIADFDAWEFLQSSADSLGIKLPQEAPEGVEDEMADELQAFLLQKEAMRKKIDESMPELIKTIKSASERLGGSMDLYGTAVEQRRAAENGQRLFELGVAEVYLAMGDTAQAKAWFDKTSAQQTINAYSTTTLAVNAYIEARLADSEGRVDDALRHYESAVQYWYFNPFTTLDVIDARFPSTTFLLESAARYALQNGDAARSAYFIELARHASIGNPRLYGFMEDADLTVFQGRLEQDFLQLESQARQRAQELNQNAIFEKALVDSRKRRKTSSRAAMTPLMPMYTALDPLLDWLDAEGLNNFLGNLEQFNNLWSNRSLQAHRKRLLAAENNYQVSKSNENISVILQRDPDILAFRTSSWKARQWKSYEGATPQFQNTKKIDLPSIEEFRKQVEVDVSIVSLWLTEKDIFIFHIDNEGVTGELKSADEIMPLLDRLSRTYDEQLAKALFTTLFSGIETKLKSRLILLVNGALQNIPFAALKIPDNNTYLNDSYLISYSPSLEEIFSYSSSSKQTHGNLLVLAPTNVPGQQQLPGARKEATMLRKKFRARVYVDQQVTPARIESEAPKYKILHYAGHAALDQALPSFSHLALFSENADEQSLFYIDNIKGLAIEGTELVVLSACESAKANSYDLGNEFSTMASAFLFAGAKSVVSSLHEVSDETTLVLMEKFYEQLVSGKSKDRALQLAQRYIRENVSTDPKHWAAFIVIGRNDPIVLD